MGDFAHQSIIRPWYVPRSVELNAGVLTLHWTLRAVSAYPLVVMVTESLPQSSRDILSNSGLEMEEVTNISPAAGTHPGFDANFARFHDTWTKLRAFGLSSYDRVILIDSDMIFTRPMDELFDLDLPFGWVGAAPACTCNPFKIAHYPKDW
jgi:alpha-N-acetylglucosamine transferase